jgi:hypothetical protein
MLYAISSMYSSLPAMGRWQWMQLLGVASLWQRQSRRQGDSSAADAWLRGGRRAPVAVGTAPQLVNFRCLEAVGGTIDFACELPELARQLCSYFLHSFHNCYRDHVLYGTILFRAFRGYRSPF